MVFACVSTSISHFKFPSASYHCSTTDVSNDTQFYDAGGNAETIFRECLRVQLYATQRPQRASSKDQRKHGITEDKITER